MMLTAVSTLVLAGCTVDFGTGSDCGNGVIQGDETCDDGNTATGDGCGASCQVEDGWGCVGEPSVCDTVCGDGVARGTEACDGEDLRTLTCAQLGLGGGTLACSSSCDFDTSGCDLQAVCGNGAVEYPEECDGGNLGGLDCADYGFNSGELTCRSNCTVDSSGCENQSVCGNDALEPGEECDGAELGGETCESLGLGAGDLSCTGDCGFDTSDCSAVAVCGNGTIEFPEVCDSATLGGETCETQGYYSGTLACRADCLDFDRTACGGLCGDGIVQIAQEECDGSPPPGQDCTSHGFYSGTLGCTGGCQIDTSGCSGFCGDGAVNGTEECDGANLDNKSCDDYGLFGGTLACSGNCQADTSGCNQTPKIVINELNHGSPDSVELLNLSPLDVNLLGYSLLTYGTAAGAPTPKTFALPSYNLAAGARVTVMESGVTNPGAPPTVDPGAQTIAYDDSFHWAGGVRFGSATLADVSGATVDYVRWVDPSVPIPSDAVWADTPRFLHPVSGDIQSLSRVPDGADTDTAGDFCVTHYTRNQPNTACLDPAAGATVLITEVDVGAPDIIEIYNAGPGSVDLDGWTVYWYSEVIDYGGTTLPSFVLGAGDYVTIRDTGVVVPVVVSNYIAVRNIVWGTADDAAAGLIDPAGVGRDFVRWNGSNHPPWDTDVWSDQPSPLPALSWNTTLGRSNLSDTNTAGDWCEMNPSLGLPNGNCL